MITRDDFSAIDKEIKEAIDVTLNNLRNTNTNDYILFLSNGEYKKEFEGRPYSPYVIDDRMDGYKDDSRLEFLSEFMNIYYTLPVEQNSTDDNRYRIHIELMIYTHIWESKPFLKKLLRLAELTNGQGYNWDVEIPDMGKHDLIRGSIRQLFLDKGNALGTVIRNGFHTSLRNAFAHSEYCFDPVTDNKRILLFNNEEAWQLREISLDDWSKRFVYSALLSFHFLEITHTHRITLIEKFGTDVFEIKHPTKGGDQMVKIKYRPAPNAFNFER